MRYVILTYVKYLEKCLVHISGKEMLVMMPMMTNLIHTAKDELKAMENLQNTPVYGGRKVA